MVIGYVIHDNPDFPNNFIFDISRLMKSRVPRIRLSENSTFAFNFSFAPELPLKTVVTKQEFGFSAGIFYPLGDKFYLKITTGLRRELQRERSFFRDDYSLNENYVYYFSPTLTF
ncbi:MAG: hypothetical protein HRT90_09760 [Candidatus Margulisbacteria bacterium]|nr:hypothetical protein [Candidatus Margulisiibacteriota bacterium]